MGLRVTTPPADEPVSLADARAHLRVDGTDEDALIGGLIVAAREYAEGFTGRRFVTTDMELTLEQFPAGGIVRFPANVPHDVRNLGTERCVIMFLKVNPKVLKANG